MTRRRWRALLGLLLFVAGTLGSPSLDALFFDHHHHDAVAHIEAADTDAHSERCVLGTLATPVTPADPPIACGRFEAVLVPAGERAPSTPVTTRVASSVLGPRAPPARA
jgi:hypothetical protein